MQFFLFLALIFTFVLVFFAVQNSEIITLRFIKWTFDGSVAFLFALTFALGMFVGIFLSIPTWWRKRKENRAQRRRIAELEKELLNAAGSKDKDMYEMDEAGE